jgi:hypothetical protein
MHVPQLGNFLELKYRYSSLHVLFVTDSDLHRLRRFMPLPTSAAERGAEGRNSVVTG